jgi:excisionase family DNA binding protein
MQDKQFYSPADIANELAVSTSTVLRLIHDGRLPAVRVSERIYRVPAETYKRYREGTLEVPFAARLGPVKSEPRLAGGEALPRRTRTDRSPQRPPVASRNA